MQLIFSLNFHLYLDEPKTKDKRITLRLKQNDMHWKCLHDVFKSKRRKKSLTV